MKSIKQIIKTYFFMFSLYKEICPQRLIMLPFYFICQAASPFAPIVFPALIIDNLINGSDLSTIIILVLGMCLSGLILKFAIEIMGEYDIVWDACFAFQITGTVLQKYMEIDMEDTESGEIYNLYSLANESLDKGIGYFVDYVQDMSIAILQLIGVSFIISTMNPFLIPFMVGFTVLLSFVQKKSLKFDRDFDHTAMDERRKYRYIYDTANDFQYGKEIRIYGIRDRFVARIEDINNRYLKSFKKFKKGSHKYQILYNSISFIQQAGTYIYMIFSFATKSITIGQFTIYLASIENFTQALTKAGSTLTKMNDMSYRIIDLQKFLSIESKLEKGNLGKVGIQNCQGFDIRFENVSFSYPDTELMILKNVNLSIPYGEKLVIVGENGAGKTTFIKLLLRLYDPTEGAIYLGNINIKDLSLEEYHRVLASIFQDYRMFSFSIRDNISFGIQPEITDNEIMEALMTVNLDEKIESLPKGLDTFINRDYEEDGIQMSGGETQRLAIARAIVRKAEIIIMDECTSALDAIAEAEIYQFFKGAIKDKTSIFVSHRMSTARFGNKIALFQDGEIIEYGSFNDLMKKQCRFYTMYNMQAKYYVDTNKENHE